MKLIDKMRNCIDIESFRETLDELWWVLPCMFALVLLILGCYWITYLWGFVAAFVFMIMWYGICIMLGTYAVKIREKRRNQNEEQS